VSYLQLGTEMLLIHTQECGWEVTDGGRVLAGSAASGATGCRGHFDRLSLFIGFIGSILQAKQATEA
jgi:hypothetical protein